jgi:diadenosine tetraphosphate (Ap4A) HIT family hydrolase
MPETSQEWHDRVVREIAERGIREQDPLSWKTWPWVEGYVVRPIEAPSEELARHGAGGVDCFVCAAVDDPGDYLVWRDELAMIGRKRGGTPLPILAFLMPRRHADLADLTDGEGARLGVLLTHLERAVTEVLDVPRIQAARWGDGSEHLHWWIYGRPTGVLELRGTFLALWEDLLPVRDPRDERRDLDLVMARLVELVGGEALPG